MSASFQVSSPPVRQRHGVRRSILSLLAGKLQQVTIFMAAQANKAVLTAGGIKPMSALPGPPALPFIGNLTQMLGYKRPQTHIVWTKWAMKYGPLYRYGLASSTHHHSLHTLGPRARRTMCPGACGLVTFSWLTCRVSMPGQTFVVVADPALLPIVLGRPGLPKSRVYELGFFVSITLCELPS